MNNFKTNDYVHSNRKKLTSLKVNMIKIWDTMYAEREENLTNASHDQVDTDRVIMSSFRPVPKTRWPQWGSFSFPNAKNSHAQVIKEKGALVSGSYAPRSKS